MANNNPTFVVTGKVRLSFAHVFKPYINPKNPGQEAKYSVTILLPKSDTATKARIDAAIEAAKQLGAQSKWGGQIPPQLAVCIHDGDGVRPSDGSPFGPECKDHWVFTASSNQAPQVVDVNLNPIIDQSQIYSGCYGRVSINFFPYLNRGRKGIGCGLGNVQKLEDGEPLGNRTTAASDFGDPAIGPYGPVYAGQPAQQFAGQPQQVNPITGQPIPGGVYGINR